MSAYGVPKLTYSFSTSAFTPQSVAGSALALASGTYHLRLTGSIELDGGGYMGHLAMRPTSAVPEPTTVACIAAGPMGLGVLRRRDRRSSLAA